MAISISAKVDITINEWSAICEELALSKPEISSDNSHATVTKELYEEYKKEFERIVDMSKGLLLEEEVLFLRGWNIIDTARVELLLKNDSEEWQDIYFQ